METGLKVHPPVARKKCGVVYCSECGKRVRVYLRGEKMTLLCPQHPTARRVPATYYAKKLRELRRELSKPAERLPVKPLPSWHPNWQSFINGAGI